MAISRLYQIYVVFEYWTNHCGLLDIHSTPPHQKIPHFWYSVDNDWLSAWIFTPYTSYRSCLSFGGVVQQPHFVCVILFRLLLLVKCPQAGLAVTFPEMKSNQKSWQNDRFRPFSDSYRGHRTPGILSGRPAWKLRFWVESTALVSWSYLDFGGGNTTTCLCVFISSVTVDQMPSSRAGCYFSCDEK